MSSPAGSLRGVTTVTIAGGGIAALELVLGLRALAPDADIELLAPSPDAEYRPLAVLEPYALGEMPALSLDHFASEQRASLRRDTLVAVEPEEHRVVTGRGERVPFELLVVAAGARSVETLPGAIVLRSQGDRRHLALVLDEVARGTLRRLVFAVPAGQGWSLPAYELALLAAATLRARGSGDAELAVVTPEPKPLALFGSQGSQAVERLLDEAGIAVHTGSAPERLEDGALVTASGERIPADRVVALPRLIGPGFPGLPSDDQGFVVTDEHGHVEKLEDVYAAGDVTNFPVKQGGLATQQADAVAESIAARLGADVEPAPFRPVLRGMLLTGAGAQPLGVGGEQEQRPALFAASRKVMGRYLLPYLAGPTARDEPTEAHGALEVSIDLDPVRPPSP